MTILVRFLLSVLVATFTASGALQSEPEGKGGPLSTNTGGCDRIFDLEAGAWIRGAIARRWDRETRDSLFRGGGSMTVRVLPPQARPSAPKYGPIMEETLRRWEFLLDNEPASINAVVPRFRGFLLPVGAPLAEVFVSKIFWGLQDRGAVGGFVQRLEQNVVPVGKNEAANHTEEQDFLGHMNDVEVSIRTHTRGVFVENSDCHSGVFTLNIIYAEGDVVDVRISLFSGAGPEQNEIAVEFLRMGGNRALFYKVLRQAKVSLGDICGGACLVNVNEEELHASAGPEVDEFLDLDFQDLEDLVSEERVWEDSDSDSDRDPMIQEEVLGERWEDLGIF